MMENRNLALGLKATVTEFVPSEKSYKMLEKGAAYDILTDGHIGDAASCYGGSWVHFYRGIGRRINIDLGDEYAISGFETAFIHDVNMGIHCPEEVRFLLSEDGKDFYEVGSVKAPYPVSFKTQLRAPYKFSLEKGFKARYAALEFNVEVNVFIDSIKINGHGLEGGERTLSGTPSTIKNLGRYALRGEAGANDICLLYYGYYPENERVAKMDKEALMPYVAYIGEDGSIKDTMFDGLMFLIVQGRCPSGGSMGYHGKNNYYSDWEYIEDVLFEKDYNLDALNDAYGDVKKALYLDKNEKLKVYLTAPTAKISNEVFGDYNGDGIEEKLLSTEDCVDAYSHFIDGVQRRFDALGYENIEIAGWFWGNETVSRSNRDDEEEYAAGCVKAMHERGYKVVFIPYFQAGGSEKAEKVGFDCTTMQPGLSFNACMQANEEHCFEDFTEFCKRYGFGVEIEIHQGVRAKEIENREKYTRYFKRYLRSCVENGMMTDTVHTYYQCAGPGVYYDCAKDADKGIRALYDHLYKFIKGTLTVEDLDGKREETPAEKVEEKISEKAEEIKEEIRQEIKQEIKESVEETPKEEVLRADIDAEEEDFIPFDIETPQEKREKLEKRKKELIRGVAAGAIAAGAIYAIYKAIKGKK